MQPIFDQNNQDNFDIALHSTYTITATGKALVEQKFVIKNKTPELFVSKYSIVVSSTNLENIEITHNGKKIEHTVNKQKGQTISTPLSLTKWLAKAKPMNCLSAILIRYCFDYGKVLEINIPELADHTNIKLINWNCVSPAF
jgi:hypothetical protein